MAKLPELCEIQYGYAFDSACFTEDNTHLPLVRIRDVKRGYSETFYSGNYPSDYVIDSGSLLVGMDGEFNIARWKGGHALLNQRVCKITAKENMNEEYIRFALSKALKEIENRTAFVTVKHLSAKELNQLEIDIPNYTTQTAVAKVLTQIESIISARQQQLQKLDEFVKARFVELFGELDKNPYGWKLSSLGALIASCEAGWSGTGTQRKKRDGEVAVLKVSAVTKGYFIPSECKVLDNQSNIKKYIYPQTGDLLFSRANTREMVGATVVITEDFPEHILPDKLWKIRFVEAANVWYMKYALSSKPIRSIFSSISTGTSGSMYNVSMEKFKSIEIPLPPLNLQNQFAAFVTQTDKSKAAIQKALDEAQLLFDSLMQKYFG